MGPRGKQNKFRNKHNKNNSKFKGNKNNSKFKGNKKRKTYSLYPTTKNKNQFQSKGKRKPEFEEPKRNVKQPKIEEQPQIEDYSSSSEEDEENNMKRLLETFDSDLSQKKSLAIDSSSDDTSDEDAADDNVEDERKEKEVSDSNGIDSDDISEDFTDEENSDEKVSDEEYGNDDDGGLKMSDDDEEISEDESDDIHSNNSKLKKKSTKSLDTENEHNISEEKVPEIVEENEIDIEAQNEDDNLNQNLLDPFARHLFYDLSENLLNAIQSAPSKIKTVTEHWPVLGKIIMQIPTCEEERIIKNKFSIAEDKRWAPLGDVPKRLDEKKHNLSNIYIKSQIVNNIAKANKSLLSINVDLPLTSLQREMFSIINNYQDFYYPYRTIENAEEIRFVYCLHVVNHILKTRTKVLHHNARLSKKDDVPEEFRDQGLVRPKIIIIVPFRDSAYRIINMITDILITEDKGNVLNKNRFLEEFTGHELTIPKKNPKPEDYEQTFSGNTGDDFRIGITVTKKSLKLFADFYSSDIIIASPLGLRTIIGAEGEPERDYDFLASTELLILDQMEILMMQNWDHVLHVLNHLHLQPKDAHGTDFSRVRTWSLNGWAKYYRQTLLFSSIIMPDFTAVFNKRCFNYAGKIKVVNSIETGAICRVFNQLPHVFHKFSTDSAADSVESRFQFFVNKILPQQRDTLMKQTLIFIPSYFDYVRLRNYFKREDIGFVQICEYSKEGKVARARDMFFHGDAHFLLYTERHHFFHRIRIKGIRHLVFYQPPVFPHFYYEMCNLMQEGNMNRKIGSTSNMTVSVIYSKYDVNQLAAIVGMERAAKMLQSDRNVHMFVTDGKQSSKNVL